MTEAQLADRPMWCDPFDMDLPKVISDARSLLGAAGDRVLYTHNPGGVLNAPAAWHTELGLTSFFGVHPSNPAKPPEYWTTSPVIACTGWEVVRDLWCHHQVMMVEGQVCWRPDLLLPCFHTLMTHRRGWREVGAAERRLAELRVRVSLCEAAACLERLTVA